MTSLHRCQRCGDLRYRNAFDRGSDICRRCVKATRRCVTCSVELGASELSECGRCKPTGLEPVEDKRPPAPVRRLWTLDTLATPRCQVTACGSRSLPGQRWCSWPHKRHATRLSDEDAWARPGGDHTW